MLLARTALPRRLAFTTIARPLLIKQLQPLKLSIRPVASSVSNQPGSSSLPHAAQNIKEEVSHTIEDIATKIAGRRATTTAKDTKLEGGFVGITSAVASTVPT
jgi:hypothetical protein